MRAVLILAPGPLALLQDLGRPGNAHLGVPPSGALDRPATRLANRLVGNEESATVLELLLGGLRLRAQCSCTIAVTAPRVAVTVDGAEVGSHAPVHLPDSAELGIGTPPTGARCYLAISGGFDVPAHLGSTATDVLSGIGPPPPGAGDVLPLGTPAGLPVGADVIPPPRIEPEIVLPLVLGPREDWFGAGIPGRLASGTWTVSTHSDRIGLRLHGPALERAPRYRDAELPSEPIITGAVQVPPDGEPVIFLADHPTTGGYPVVGVVPEPGFPALAQARPGTTVRFRPVRSANPGTGSQ